MKQVWTDQARRNAIKATSGNRNAHAKMDAAIQAKKFRKRRELHVRELIALGIVEDDNAATVAAYLAGERD